MSRELRTSVVNLEILMVSVFEEEININNKAIESTNKAINQ